MEIDVLSSAQGNLVFYAQSNIKLPCAVDRILIFSLSGRDMERERERELVGALSPVNHIGLYQG